MTTTPSRMVMTTLEIMRRSLLLLVLSLLVLSSFTGTTVNAQSSDSVDCSQFQDSVTLDMRDQIKLEFVVTDYDEATGDGIFRARVTCQRPVWVGLGFVPLNSRSMVPGDAVIGIPDPADPQNGGAVGHYTMTRRELAGVQLAGTNRQQNIINGTVTQTNGVSVMEFSRRLLAPDEVPLDAKGLNTFLWAYGFDNPLSIHGDRGIVNLQLRVCDGSAFDSDGVTVEIIGGGTQEGLWNTHTAMAGIAWTILSPLAIASSLLRNYLPEGKLWLRMHVWLNMSVVALTIGAVLTAVAAYQNDKMSHFSGVTHATVGLVILIFSILQVLGGIFRAHAPGKQGDGSVEPRSTIRKLWELGHKGMGIGLVGLCWWQITTGIDRLLVRRLITNDYTAGFLGFVGGLVAVIGALFLYDFFFGKREDSDQEMKEGSHP